MEYSGSRFNCSFEFIVQEKPGGIAQALGLAEAFAAGDSICAILGDNIFFDDISSHITSFDKGGHIFLRAVHDPERFGVAEITQEGGERGECTVLSIAEKPEKPKSNLAMTGCYLFDGSCFDIITNLAPSNRGEYEITDLCAAFMNKKELGATILEEEWIDAGTFDSLFRAAELVKEKRS